MAEYHISNANVRHCQSLEAVCMRITRVRLQENVHSNSSHWFSKKHLRFIDHNTSTD